MRWKINKKHLIAIPILLLGVLVIGFWPKQEEDLALPDRVDFNYHIRPILSQNCFTCHGPDANAREANLRLDNFEGATALLESGGAAIVPGKIHKSLLIDRITFTDPELIMPPPEAKKTLSPREIALLKRWIKQGAEWKPHWAFIPPEMPALPDNLLDEGPTRVIDHLIEKTQLTNQLKPAPLAQKNALIRRLAFILTGLPPSPKEVNSFLTDSTEDAYEKIVDYYLASPHFGERWARHWMDLVRYGESMGHEGDFNISAPWQYRDYLIRAFNQDVPYNQFVKEHLAGDMLEEARYHPREDFNESMIGTGYFYLGEGKHSPVSVRQEEADKIDNMIDVTSKTFQGLTVACARCHDHKFDPIPTTDYYAMYGMIESARLGPLPARRTRQQEKTFKELIALKKEIRSHVGAQWTSLVEQPTPQFISQQKRFISNLEQSQEAANDSLDYQLIVDFRTGDWEGWYSDGWAFGDGPLMGEPIIDDKSGRIEGMRSGVASSRVYGTGIQGVLRSPNFVIEHDSMLIRATGKNGSIRLIADNFQVIQNPLYGSLRHIVNNEQSTTYIMDLTLLKGRKAYLQFMPGYYGEGTTHIYRIEPEDYIEVEYAAAFSKERPHLPPPQVLEPSNASLTAKKTAISDWVNNQASPEQVQLLNRWLKKNPGKLYTPTLPDLISESEKRASQLYDSTHFIGMTEGQAIFSPVFIRGSINQLGKEKIPRQFLQVIDAGPETFPQEGSGRLAWAEAVVDPANPLTSRVMVNRIWHHLFGRGIVETVDNFGLQGKLPSHPDLLDYLAIRFIEDGWSMKTMIKHVLLSNTFQRTTEAIAENQNADPNNILLHHFPIRRLEAEAIRDGILAISGSLDLSLFGPPVPVHLTNFMTGRGRPRESGPLDGNGRRSIYISVRRNFIPPMMLAFDMPIPFSTFGRRNTTNVPAQSLTLMNDPFVQEQARIWAEKLLAQGEASIADRIQAIYSLAFSREASSEEIQEAKSFLENQAKQYESSLEEMQEDPLLWTDYCHAIFNLKEFIHLI